MFDNLIAYHMPGVPASADAAPAYRYVPAGSAVFRRAETRFLTLLRPVASLRPVTTCTVRGPYLRGLPPLRSRFRLQAARLPVHLPGAVPAGSLLPDDGAGGVLCQFYCHDHACRCSNPRSKALLAA